MASDGHDAGRDSRRDCDRYLDIHLWRMLLDTALASGEGGGGGGVIS